MRLSRIPFGARLLLLDEPTANLDLPGCRLLEEKLRQQETFVLVSHDRELLDRLCNRIWYLEGGGLRCYDGNYTAFEQAQELEKLTQTRARNNTCGKAPPGGGGPGTACPKRPGAQGAPPHGQQRGPPP